MIFKIFISIFLSAFLTTAFFACSRPELSETPPSEPSPTPSKKPPEPKPPETVWTCKISNGAGRIFVVTDSFREVAESKAHHECSIYSRTCFLLDCNPTTE